MLDAKSDVITIAVSKSTEREYRNRKVFPSIRQELSIYECQKLFFTIPVELAHDLLCDAYDQREDKRLRPGVRRVYTMLAKSLMSALNVEPQPVAQKLEPLPTGAPDPVFPGELTGRELALIRAVRNMPPDAGRMLMGLAKSYGDMMDMHKESRAANRPPLRLVQGGAA